ncbi:MAG: hypothetical protein ACO1Q7_02050 [Gemmatimonas sp.]
MLQSVFIALTDFVKPVSDSIAPVAVRAGDLIACSSHNDKRAFVSVHSAADGKALREFELYWTVASAWLFDADQDDLIFEIKVKYLPISLLPADSPHPDDASPPLHALR